MRTSRPGGHQAPKVASEVQANTANVGDAACNERAIVLVIEVVGAELHIGPKHIGQLTALKSVRRLDPIFNTNGPKLFLEYLGAQGPVATRRDELQVTPMSEAPSVKAPVA